MKPGDKVSFYSRGMRKTVEGEIVDGPRRKPLGRRVGSWCSRNVYYAERAQVRFTDTFGQVHTEWIRTTRLNVPRGTM